MHRPVIRVSRRLRVCSGLLRWLVITARDSAFSSRKITLIPCLGGRRVRQLPDQSEYGVKWAPSLDGVDEPRGIDGSRSDDPQVSRMQVKDVLDLLGN